MEGKNSTKRIHLHAVLGNVPSEYLDCVDVIVKQAWAECDFGYREVVVKPITNAAGWAGYMTKDTGRVNYDALDVVNMHIPQIIQQSI